MINKADVISYATQAFFPQAMLSMQTELKDCECELLSYSVDKVTFKLRLTNLKLRYLKVTYLPIKDIFKLDYFDPYNIGLSKTEIEVIVGKALYYDLIDLVNNLVYCENKQQVLDNCAQTEGINNNNIKDILLSLFHPFKVDINCRVIDDEVVYLYYIDQMTYPITFGIHEKTGGIRVGYNSSCTPNDIVYNNIHAAICELMYDIAQYTGTYDNNKLFLHKLMSFMLQEMDYFIQLREKRTNSFAKNSDVIFTDALKNILKLGGNIDVKTFHQEFLSLC